MLQLTSPKRAVLFPIQRLARGFSDNETYLLDRTVALFLAPRLKRFRGASSGIRPSRLSQEQWDHVLDELEWLCQAYESDEARLSDLALQQRLDNAARILGEHFMDLWW